MSRILLQRHGQTEWNAQGRLQGQLDTPLSDAGLAQSEAAAAGLLSAGVSRIWSSDLTRAVQTAEVSAARLHLPIVTDPRLRERDLGLRAGLTDAEFATRHPEHYVPRHLGLAPGEEPADHLVARVVAAISEVAGELGDEEVALVVSHGFAIKSALVGFLGWGEETLGSLRGMDNCRFTVLELLEPGTAWKLVGYNVSLG